MQESKDHVFPRGLGGKLDADLWVYDCERCRASISKAEDEVVHRSHLSIYRFARGLLPRHKKRPSSGLIEPRISLVKNPTTNRYAVFSLRTGTSHPRTLPALEVNLASGELYFHGSGPEDTQTLISNTRLLLRQKPDTSGQIGAITLRQLDEFLPDIVQDPDFNPRIYLSAREQLEICARNPEEGLATIRAVTYLVSTDALASYESSGWQTWQMPGSTPHTIVFEHDGQLFDRVVLKIACGLVGAYLRVNASSALNLPTAQKAIRGDSELPPGMVIPLSGLTQKDRQLPAQLIAVVGVRAGRLIGLVGLYEEWYVSDLGIPPNLHELPKIIGAMCQVTENREQRWLSMEEAEGFMRAYEQGDLGVPFQSEADSPSIAEQ
jgi:hypothetical protein